MLQWHPISPVQAKASYRTTDAAQPGAWILLTAQRTAQQQRLCCWWGEAGLMDGVWLNQPNAVAKRGLTRAKRLIHRKRGGTDSLKGRERRGRLGRGRRCQEGDRRIGQGSVSRLSPQQAASLCPSIKLLQRVMQYTYFPLKSIAHLTADLYNVTFAYYTARGGILGIHQLWYIPSRSLPNLWSTQLHLHNLLWQHTSPFIKNTLFKQTYPLNTFVLQFESVVSKYLVTVLPVT